MFFAEGLTCWIGILHIQEFYSKYINSFAKMFSDLCRQSIQVSCSAFSMSKLWRTGITLIQSMHNKLQKGLTQEKILK